MCAMRLSKAAREQRAAQYLITTLCVWDVEQRWDLDRELTYAWDKGRFDDPYRTVMLPKYPATRQGVCAALGVQFGVDPQDLATHVAEGTVYADYAKPWEVAIQSLQKLTTLVRWEKHYGTRIWRVAAGTLDVHQAYREQSTDAANRTPDQKAAIEALWELGDRLHRDDLAKWIGNQVAFGHPRYADMTAGRSAPVSRYRLLRDVWHQLDVFDGAQEQAAFYAFLQAEMPHVRESWRFADDLRRWTTCPPTTPECFQALGLTYPCTAEEVRHAYRHLAKVAHPDTGGTDDAFYRLAAAYEDALKFLEAQTSHL